jgi:hypothetical protein
MNAGRPAGQAQRGQRARRAHVEVAERIDQRAVQVDQRSVVSSQAHRASSAASRRSTACSPSGRRSRAATKVSAPRIGHAADVVDLDAAVDLEPDVAPAGVDQARAFSILRSALG